MSSPPRMPGLWSSVVQPRGHGRCHVSEPGADGRTDQDVTGVVHPGVHARERHDRSRHA